MAPVTKPNYRKGLTSVTNGLQSEQKPRKRGGPRRSLTAKLRQMKRFDAGMSAAHLRSRCFAAAALLALTVLAMSPAHAQWAWRDANGRITASDRPPPNTVADKDIVSRPKTEKRRTDTAAAPVGSAAPTAVVPVAAPAAAPAPAAEAPKTALDKEVEARKLKAEQEQAAKKKAEEAKQASARAENCQRARQQMASLDSGIRIARVNANGEREILDDAGRAAEARKARDVIGSDCR
jgi:hypothetical protein